jgi:hypothetical protein
MFPFRSNELQDRQSLVISNWFGKAVAFLYIERHALAASCDS